MVLDKSSGPGDPLVTSVEFDILYHFYLCILKFVLDWCFGLAKQCFHCTKVRNLDYIANVISIS